MDKGHYIIIKKHRKFIVFNRFTGEILELNRKEIDKFNFDNFEPLTLDKADNFLVTIEMSRLCNLNCLYCYQDKSIRTKCITSDYLDKIISYIINCLKNERMKYAVVGFIGGEPLLHKSEIINFMLKLNASAKIINKVIFYHFDTNGTISFDDLYYSFRNIEFSISLTPKMDHNRIRWSKSFDSYEKIINNLKSISKSGNNRIVLRYNVNELNINLFESFVKFIRKEFKCIDTIEPMYTDNYDKNISFYNKLSINDFVVWNSTEALDVIKGILKIFNCTF